MLMSGGKAINANYTQPLSTGLLFKGTIARLSCKISPVSVLLLSVSQFYKNCDIIDSVLHYCHSYPR